MRVAQAEELTARVLAVLPIDELFGEAGGAFVRGYTTGELAVWTQLATDGAGKLDERERDIIQFCSVVISGPEPDARPLFCGETGKPRRVDLDHVREHVLPGELSRAVRASDALSGFNEQERRRLLASAAAGGTSADGASIDSAEFPPSSTPPM